MVGVLAAALGPQALDVYSVLTPTKGSSDASVGHACEKHAVESVLLSRGVPPTATAAADGTMRGRGHVVGDGSNLGLSSWTLRDIRRSKRASGRGRSTHRSSMV